MTYLKSRAESHKHSARRRRKSRDRRDRNKRLKRLLTSAKPSAPVDEIQVTGVLDQHKERWLHVSKGDQQGLVRLSAIYDGTMWRQLAREDIFLTRSRSRGQVMEQIEHITEWPQAVYVAARPGFHCGAFVKPDASLIGRPNNAEFRVVFDEPEVPLATAGTLAGWKRAVTSVRGQPTFILPLCLAFVGPILELFPNASNIIIDLSGDSSSGKSTALGLCASVWGAPVDSPGSLALKLRTTPVGMEQHMIARAGTLLALDEVNLLAVSVAQQGAALAELAMAIAEGTIKHRYKAAGMTGLRFGCFITSNVPFPRLIADADPANREAAVARTITVPVDAGTGHRSWTSLPEGCANGKAASLALSRALLANYGHAADAFLRQLVRQHRRDHLGLLNSIARHRARFLRSLPPAANAVLGRRDESFSLMYAAAALASEYGVLPISRRELRRAMLECHGRSLVAYAEASAAQSSSLDRVRAYAAANQNLLLDLDTQPLFRMRKDQLNMHAGFLKTVFGQRCLLMRAERWNREFGVRAFGMLQELRATRHLQARDGLHLQTRVRRNREHDRVYAVALE